MNHQLQILSLGHRASARCSCGRWAHVLRERMPHQAERRAALEREDAKHVAKVYHWGDWTESP